MITVIADSGAAGKAKKVKFVMVGLNEGGVEASSESMAINR